MKNNNFKWFDSPKTLEELKRQYKKLAFENHPDRGGSDEAMKEINAEYDLLFSRLKNIHENADGETYEASSENTETADEFKEILEELIHLDGLIIELCGSWLWISGNTYSHREKLKELHFRFSNNKKMWYYHTGERKTRTNKSFSMEEMSHPPRCPKLDNDSLLSLSSESTWSNIDLLTFL